MALIGPDPQSAHPTVRSLGTEGRKGNPNEEVPANDNVYESVPSCVPVHTFSESLTHFNRHRSFIVFRASDVKDLQIEGPAEEEAAKSAAPSDPAIVGVRRITETTLPREC